MLRPAELPALVVSCPGCLFAFSPLALGDLVLFAAWRPSAPSAPNILSPPEFPRVPPQHRPEFPLWWGVAGMSGGTIWGRVVPVCDSERGFRQCLPCPAPPRAPPGGAWRPQPFGGLGGVRLGTYGQGGESVFRFDGGSADHPTQPERPTKLHKGHRRSRPRRPAALNFFAFIFSPWRRPWLQPASSQPWWALQMSTRRIRGHGLIVRCHW